MSNGGPDKSRHGPHRSGRAEASPEGHLSPAGPLRLQHACRSPGGLLRVWSAGLCLSYKLWAMPTLIAQGPHSHRKWRVFCVIRCVGTQVPASEPSSSSPLSPSSSSSSPHPGSTDAPPTRHLPGGTPQSQASEPSHRPQPAISSVSLIH